MILAVLLLILPGVGYSQGAALESEVDTELEHLYVDKLPEKRVAPNSPIIAPAVSTKAAPVTTAQPIYILNQAPQASVQKQPTTVVEASPLTESKADQMRKSRIDAESQTETKIVEKLEQSRLDDEKRRADVLFGSKFDRMASKSSEQASEAAIQTNVAPVPQPQQVVPVQVIQAPAPVTPAATVEPKETLTREAVRQELESVLKAEQEAPVTPVEQKYFSALVGFPDYPDSTNVRGNYSLGASFGTKYDDTYSVEGSFIFSNYTMNPIYFNGYVAPDMDVNQYAASVGVKYYFFGGMVRPFAGGLGQYTYRSFQWNQNYNYYNYYQQNDTSTNSHAIDLGVNVGADVVFNPKLTVGFDYRYFFNIASRRNSSAFVYQPYYGTPIEQIHSSLMSISAKVQF